MKAIRVILVTTMLTLLLCILGVEDTSAYATMSSEGEKRGTRITTVSNELEYLNSLLNATDAELRERGLSDTDIYKLRTYDYNSALLELAKNKEYILKKMGYSAWQIDKIKAYDGQEDAVAYASTYGLSNANLTGDIWVVPIEPGKSAGILYVFEWNTMPIFRQTDCIGLAWMGCKSGASEATTKVTWEWHNVAFYNSLTGESVFSEEPKVSKGINTRTLKFDMEHIGLVSTNYAKEISGQVKIATTDDSTVLSQVIISAAYGHTVIGTSGTISITSTGPGFTLSTAWNQEELYSECYTYNADGTLAN